MRFVVSLVLVGCSGAQRSTTTSMSGPDAPEDNVAACMDWVERHNTTPCAASMPMKPDEACPETLNATPVDLRAWYHCMADGIRCKGGRLDLSKQTKCVPPSLMR